MQSKRMRNKIQTDKEKDLSSTDSLHSSHKSQTGVRSKSISRLHPCLPWGQRVPNCWTSRTSEPLSGKPDWKRSIWDAE